MIGMGSSGDTGKADRGLAEGIKAELAQRLPRQRKTQRDKLAVLVATMLQCAAPMVEVAAGLPRASDRWDMGYQWISRYLANGFVCCR